MPSHPARAFVSARFDKVSKYLEGMFGEAAPDIFSAWDGLQLLWLYLPERVDLVQVLDSFIARRVAHEQPDGLAPMYAEVTTGAKAATDGTPRTREQAIIAAAATAFSRNGYRSTSLREIASDLGTSHGSLLYYFANKEALLEAVLDSRDQLSEQALVEPQTALDALYNRYRLAVNNAQNPELVDLYSVLVCEATDIEHPAHNYFKRRFETVIDNFTADLTKLAEAGYARPDLDPSLEALLLVALWDGWQLHASYRSSLTTPERILGQLNTLVSTPLPPISDTDGGPP